MLYWSIVIETLQSRKRFEALRRAGKKGNVVTETGTEKWAAAATTIPRMQHIDVGWLGHDIRVVSKAVCEMSGTKREFCSKEY